eukprot:gb/GECH01011907.1/.p1 GENE.gb/GECH01011907.1/~~gb/GECH01011907.1/.p1  ORF type:complete len:529 (+),score=177.35 gb/GECH01011907.1/:1-1587(+)
MSQTEKELNITCTTEVESIAAKDAQDIMVMLSLQAPHHEPESRSSVDIVAVVDRSGSMDGEKLNLVKRTLQFMVRELKSQDRLGIVTFDHTVSVNLPLTYQDNDGQAKTNQAIDQILCGGTTNLCGGLAQGIAEMRARNTANETSSILLFTDGQANVGFRELEDIKKVMKSTGSLAQQAIDAGQNRRRSPQIGQNTSSRRTRTRSLFSSFSNMFGGAPAQTQQNATSQETSSNNNNTESDSTQEDTQAPLPCSIYSFGYGNDHSADLLRGIADFGEGVYFFIESDEIISEAFADCLGGLLSVTGRDLRIKLSIPDDKDDVVIDKLHNKKYKETVIQEHKHYEVKISDIQSEEQKDLLFTLRVPAISQATPDYEILKCNLEYHNVITDSTSTLTESISIDRPDQVPEGQQVNYMLDRQRNRIIAAESMEDATTKANNGGLEAAKQSINNAIEKIEKSVSGNDPFCSGLVEDLKKLKESLESRLQWESYGNKVAVNSASAHWVQRSTNTRAASQFTYETSSRAKMKKKFI